LIVIKAGHCSGCNKEFMSFRLLPTAENRCNPNQGGKSMRILALILFSLALIFSCATAETWFTLADYRDLKDKDVAVTELVLKAMREAVFYAQESVGGPVICASPLPISGPRLVELLDNEIANPTNTRGRAYTDADQVAFIFLHALKSEGACK
jgi:hypothetical protein